MKRTRGEVQGGNRPFNRRLMSIGGTRVGAKMSVPSGQGQKKGRKKGGEDNGR